MENEAKSKPVNDAQSCNAESVVLQTLKERCCLLQNRNNILEKEVIKLNIECTKYKTENKSQSTEEELNVNLAQLTKEKSQLINYSMVVAHENKMLWSRLSQLVKASDKTIKNQSSGSSCIPEKLEYPVPNLVRSQTFTVPQSTKRVSKIEEDMKEKKNSLEEISLKLLDSFLQEKSELIHQYEQMVEMQAVDENLVNNQISAPCIDENVSDLTVELKKRTEKMKQLKKRALQQLLELKKLLNRLEVEKAREICQFCNCPKNSMQEMLKKEDTNLKISSSSDGHVNAFKKEKLPDAELSQCCNRAESSASKHITQILTISKSDESHRASQEQKNQIKIPNQVCPICAGKFQHLSFSDFEYHVEKHFITDDFDSMQENYEIISNAFK